MITKKTLALAIGALLTGAATVATADELLDREKTRDLISGASGTHWFLGHRKHYAFDWRTDGKLVVKPVGAKADDEPYSEGTWRIKEVEKTKEMTDEDVAKANEALQFVYCHTIERMWSGNEICWEVHQVSFDVDKDKNPLRTQTYKLYRGEGAETGGYVITRG